MFRLQIQPCPLRGLPRHPGELWSQGILVIHRHQMGCLLFPQNLHKFGQSAELEMGIPSCLYCFTPNLTATSFYMQIDIGMHTHMLEKTPRYTKPHMSTKQALLHTQKHM